MPEERIVRAFHLCRELGMKTVSTNMTGLPGEGTPELLDTVKLNARARPDCMQVSTFHPYPHTRLYEKCREEGLLSERHVDTIFDGRSALDAPAFSAPAFRLIRENFYPVAELYSRVYDLGRAGKPLEWGLDRLLLAERLPWKLRQVALKPLLAWGERHQRFEFINY